MPLEPVLQTLSLPVLSELALAALEDIVDDIALDHPGVASSVRSRHSQMLRQAQLLERIGSLQAEPERGPALDQLFATWRRIENLASSASSAEFPELWTTFVKQLDRLDVTSPSLDAPDTGFELIPNSGHRHTLLLRSRGPATGTRTPARQPSTDPAAFVAAVTALCAAYRERNVWRFLPADRLALLRAYQLVEAGVRTPPPMVPIRTDLRRPVSTYLALADPGRSHLRHTVRRADLLKGTIVHVETIDREGIANRDQIEAYRIPAIRDVARIRVHIGDAAPCSVYVGRPVFEGWSADQTNDDQRRAVFELARLKAIHTVAAACSGLFALGVAECKIGMDGLTAVQARDMMMSLSANVIRDRTRQRLSAAFNINAPLRDDRQSRQNPVLLNDRLKVAQLAIDLAKTGGFDKVTWDGAAEGTSIPFLEQLTPADLLPLVHRAHELGLETYISAGMTAKHMTPAAQVGVGGVGIGIALHAKNAGGAITHLLPEAVREVLDARDHGARVTLAGRGAAALTQLDWMHSRGPLDDEPERQRQELLKCLTWFHGAAAESSDKIRAEKELHELVPLVEEFLASERAGEDQPTRTHLGFDSPPLPLFAAGDDEEDCVRSAGLSAAALALDEALALDDDPIFAIADGQLRAAVKTGSLEEAKKLKVMRENRDAEGLRCYLGYQ